MNRRLVITAIAVTALAGAVVPSFAATNAAAPVSPYVSTDNGIAAGFTVNGEPGAGVTVSPDDRVCAGIGEQVPQCVALVQVSTS